MSAELCQAAQFLTHAVTYIRNKLVRVGAGSRCASALSSLDGWSGALGERTPPPSDAEESRFRDADAIYSLDIGTSFIQHSSLLCDQRRLGSRYLVFDHHLLKIKDQSQPSSRRFIIYREYR